MPWTVSDVDGFKAGLSEDEKKQWVEIANSALSSCLTDGGDQEQCEGSAIRQANGSVGSNAEVSMDSYHIQSNNYSIRTEMHEGRKHIVVPVIMMVEGVHNGSAGRLLHLGEELGKFPGSWNGMPVTVPHPNDSDGTPISANSPEVIERYRVGRVFNTQFVDGKLKAEAWLDEEKLRQYSPEALGYIRQGRALDVSVGVFTEDEPTSGEWNGEAYAAIARNHRPDHLALLPGVKGACSWADGCGVRANAEGGEEIVDQITTSIKQLAGKGYHIFLNSNEQSFDDVIHQIQSKLDGMDDDVTWHFLVETFDDFFVYEKSSAGMGSGESTLFKRTYTVNADEIVEFGDDPEKVTRKIEFVTVNAKGGVRTMAECPCEAKVILVLGAEHLPFEESDREYLLTLEESHLDKLLTIKKLETQTTTGDDPPAQMGEAQVKTYIEEQFSDVDKVMDLFPAPMREQLQSGQRLHTQQRDNLISHITTNAEGIFTAEQLTAKSMDELQQLARLAKAPVDHSLNGAGNINTNQGAAGAKLLPVGVAPAA